MEWEKALEMRHVAGDKILPFRQRGKKVIFSAVSQVDAYWEALRAGRHMPDRQEVDPRGLEDALANAFILEHIASGVARIRVAGMHLNDLLGMEVRGMPITSFFTPDSRSRLGQVLDDVVAKPRVADVSLIGPRGIGRPLLQARLFLAPLATAGDAVPRMLGAFQANGSIGRTPRRFEIDQVQMRRIVAASAGPAPARAPGRQAQPRHAFAEPTHEFAGATPDRKKPGNAAGRPYLRLVTDAAGTDD